MSDRLNLISSPFDQFEITRIVPLQIGNVFDLSITNSTVYMAIAVGVYLLLYELNIATGTIVPGR